MKRETFKKDLISSLSKREMAGLAELLAKLRQPSGTAREFVMRIETSAIVGTLHKQLFGDWDSSAPAYDKVIEELDRVKEILEDTPLRVFPCPGPEYPLMPAEFRLRNREAGTAIVTVHAWRRFCGRFGKGCTTQGQLALHMQQSFEEAVKVSQEANRAITDKGFDRQEYYLDRETNCQFVLGIGNKRPVILTVLSPRRVSP